MGREETVLLDVTQEDIDKSVAWRKHKGGIGYYAENCVLAAAWRRLYPAGRAQLYGFETDASTKIGQAMGHAKQTKETSEMMDHFDSCRFEDLVPTKFVLEVKYA